MLFSSAPSSWSGHGGQIGVQFTNDTYDPEQGVGYTVIVDRIEIDGVTCESEWLHGDGYLSVLS